MHRPASSRTVFRRRFAWIARSASPQTDATAPIAAGDGHIRVRTGDGLSRHRVPAVVYGGSCIRAGGCRVVVSVDVATLTSVIVDGSEATLREAVAQRSRQ